MRTTLLALPCLVLATLALSAQAPAQRAGDSEPDQLRLTPTHTLTAHTRLVRCLAFAPDGVLATGGQDRLICLWSPAGELIRRVDLRPGGG